MKRNYIAPLVEIMPAEPVNMMAVSLTAPDGTQLNDDVTIDNPDDVQTKTDSWDIW